MSETQSVLLVIFAVLSITALIIAGVLSVGRAQYFKWKKRRATWGERYGLRLLDPRRSKESLFAYGTDPIGLQVRDEFSAIEIFKQPTGRAHHILQGEIAGRAVKIFDYQFVTGSGKSSSVHFYSIVTLDLAISSPWFELRPHTFWEKVTAFFGARDIEVGDEEFDKHFRVFAENESWLRGLVTSGLADTLISDRQSSWHCLKDRLVLARVGNALEEQVDQLVHSGLRVAQEVERSTLSPH